MKTIADVIFCLLSPESEREKIYVKGRAYLTPSVFGPNPRVSSPSKISQVLELIQKRHIEPKCNLYFGHTV